MSLHTTQQPNIVTTTVYEVLNYSSIWLFFNLRPMWRHNDSFVCFYKNIKINIYFNNSDER